MKLYVPNKSEVDIPEWADIYDVGDEITFFNPKVGEVQSDIIIGFSIRGGCEGLPVINPPKGVKAKEVAVDEKYHITNDTQ